MRYTVTKQVAQVIGYIWQPGVGVCAQQVTVDLAHMIANDYNPANRDDAEEWVSLHHCGDFSALVDMRLDFHIGDEHIVHDWKAGEESELAFNDAMYPSDDES